MVNIGTSVKTNLHVSPKLVIRHCALILHVADTNPLDIQTLVSFEVIDVSKFQGRKTTTIHMQKHNRLSPFIEHEIERLLLLVERAQGKGHNGKS